MTKVERALLVAIIAIAAVLRIVWNDVAEYSPADETVYTSYAQTLHDKGFIAAYPEISGWFLNDPKMARFPNPMRFGYLALATFAQEMYGAATPRALAWLSTIAGILVVPLLFFLGNRLSGLIDFYFACTDTLAYDVAVCLNAWCFELDHSYNVTKGRALLQAYARSRPLSSAERGRLPLLARGAALRFLLTRLVDWLDVPAGALVKPKDPLEYFRKLRFHQAARSVRDYGIAE